jgi:hypothetical protein
MKTKNLFYALSIAVAAMAVTACSSEADMAKEPIVDNTSEAPRTWQVSINAGPAETRAISVGGNSGNGLFTNWNTGDEVQVVKGSDVVGTLTATASTGNSAYAVLEGTLTGTFAVDDELTLCYHSATFDYTGQVGTLAGVSTSKGYLMATSKVTAIDVADSGINSGSGKLIMSDAAFSAQQAYLDITFTDDCGDPINISSLAITTSGGKLVSSRSVSGDYSNYISPLAVTPASPTNHFFLALRDENGASNTFTFTATTSDYGTLTYSQNLNLENGHYYTGTKVLYVEPTISVKTAGINQYSHTGYCVIGSSEDDGNSTNMAFTVSGKSRGYYIDMNNPATVTFNGIDAKLNANTAFIGGTKDDCAYVYDIQGANAIVIAKCDYALYGGFGTSSIKFQGNGTLTITSSNADCCGISSSNYTTGNNSHATTDAEVDVTSLLAADGYTVKRSARIDNADGTYTWKYTVKPND